MCQYVSKKAPQTLKVMFSLVNDLARAHPIKNKTQLKKKKKKQKTNKFKLPI